MGDDRQHSAGTGWSLVVPVKWLHLAKSRLSTDAEVRAALALAFAADTVAAALRSPSVVEVVVVTDDPAAAALVRELGAEVVPDEPDAGLNPALRHGAAHAVARHPQCGVGALSADLPALKSADLEKALRRATEVGVAVVADVDGTGTTAYLVTAGRKFEPAFGPDSLKAHIGAGATPLPVADLPTLRRDVDTRADLNAAFALGLGPHTMATLHRL